MTTLGLASNSRSTHVSLTFIGTFVSFPGSYIICPWSRLMTFSFSTFIHGPIVHSPDIIHLLLSPCQPVPLFPYPCSLCLLYCFPYDTTLFLPSPCNMIPGALFAMCSRFCRSCLTFSRRSGFPGFLDLCLVGRTSDTSVFLC